MGHMKSINFKVTPSQKKTIDLRVIENGFDDLSAYLKVVALKTQTFNLTPVGAQSDEATIELSFMVTPEQEAQIEENRKASDCSSLDVYLQYVALHGVVTSIVEVRSTGNLDDMLQRIASSRKTGSLKKLF